MASPKVCNGEEQKPAGATELGRERLPRVPGIAKHRELALSVEAGLTPTQAITLATRTAAALLNLYDRA
jgi:hypothetical protein